MNLRLKKIASMINNCESVADIGTDHAYLPIYLVKNNICKKAIASDINKGPIKKAQTNINIEGLNSKIECRLGGGFSTIKKGEVDVSIIAGMGGNLIRDIILDDEEIFKKLNYAVVQPVQNPEVFREFVYKRGYEILDEDLCFDENKYYQILKIKYSNKPYDLKDDFYDIGQKLIEKKHPLLKDYINHLIKKYNTIINSINDDTELANKRKSELKLKIRKLEMICDEI